MLNRSCLLLLTMLYASHCAVVTSPACSTVLRMAQSGKTEELSETFNKAPGATAELIACEGPIKRTPLHFAALGGHASIIDLLASKGAEIDVRERFGVTSLMYASMNGHVAAIEALLKNGADIHAFNHNHWTSLHYASRHEQLEAIRTLLKHGANPKAVNRRQQFTPYRMAEFFEKQPSMRLLEELGAKGE
eukprot:m.26940 g.26940  ORF g.26940 m.26940 type:complete len:191 (-) comp11730_c0_seq1:266-838(-)